MKLPTTKSKLLYAIYKACEFLQTPFMKLGNWAATRLNEEMYGIYRKK